MKRWKNKSEVFFDVIKAIEWFEGSEINFITITGLHIFDKNQWLELLEENRND